MKKKALVLLFCPFLLMACNTKKAKQLKLENARIEKMQTLTDSATRLYQQAIAKIQSGVSVDSVKAQFADRIMDFKDQSGAIFDTMTVDFKNGLMSQEAYDQLKAKVSFDSLHIQSEQLKKLGLDL